MTKRLVRAASAAIAALAILAGPALAQDREPQIPDLKVEKYTLPNGLEVLLHEDHTTPVVGVNLWYKVGSKNEKKGRTGFAHLFEHLMFQGSKNHDKEYFGPIEKVGAQINGSTNTDRTNYFETLPSNALELALWLEADRMGFLLPALTQQKLDNQRDVVKNERRQRVDNVPYGQSQEKMLEAMYPPDHPYHHSVIGSMADLSAASLEDVSNFFRTYYHPGNASLSIVGDFDPAEAKRLVEKYFGPIPGGPKVEQPQPNVPTLTEPKHVTMTDRVALARAQLAWPTVPVGDADEAPLDVLATILGQLPTENRLYKAMVYDKQLAAQVAAFHFASQLSGTFGVSISARPGQKLDELVAAADAVIERIKAQGPTEDEVMKARSTTESSVVQAFESTTRKADLFNQYNVVYGDPTAYRAELKRLFAVTPADVQRVARKYLGPGRVRVDVNPGPPTPRAPEVTVTPEGQEPIVATTADVKDSFDRTIMPSLAETPKFTPPSFSKKKLSNGLEVVVVEKSALPLLSLNLVVRGGADMVPAGQEGAAALMSSLLTEGTETRDALTLAGELSRLGASLDASSSNESTSLRLETLSKHTDAALALFTDVLLNPAFPPKELERLRVHRLARLAQAKNEPTAIAGRVFPKLLYGNDHPYGRPDDGTLESMKGLTREQLVELHGKLFSPTNSTLIVVGDTTADAIVAKLESALKDWKPTETAKASLPEPKTVDPTPIYLIDRPSAAQSILNVGLVGLPRSTPDYYPVTVMNAVLGGQFSSRINLNLREEKGYTYGARSSFQFAKGPGPFFASTSVQTAVTKEALAELIKELTEVSTSRPISDSELTFAKDRLIKGFPSRFETTGAVGRALEELVLYSLPDDEFAKYQERISSVNQAETERVAKAHIDPSKLVILVVGDREAIEPKLKELAGDRPIVVLDADGNPVDTAKAAGE